MRLACLASLLAIASACASSENDAGLVPAADAALDGGAVAAEGGSLPDGAAQPPADAGAVESGDAASSPAPDASSPEASVAPEGGADGGFTTCGGVPCFADQSCVAGSCQFAQCQGAHVPGDYATVQDALDAISAVGGGTICLGARTYDEDVKFSSTVSSGITFQGLSPSASIVKSISLLWSTYQNQAPLPTLTLKFRGLAIGALDLQPPSTATISLNAVTLGGTELAAAGASTAMSITYGEYDNMTPVQTLSLDGVDVSAPGGTGIDVNIQTDGVNSQDSLSIVNSFVHDSNVGVSLFAQIATTFENNTIDGNQSGVYEDTFGSSMAPLTLYNNLFDGNGTALYLLRKPPTLSQGNDAFYGNTTKFAASAVEGAGDVNADPDLDTSTVPPGLLSGSPCRNAGDAAHAPDHDFWGRPRGANIDIGAVQSP